MYTVRGNVHIYAVMTVITDKARVKCVDCSDMKKCESRFISAEQHNSSPTANSWCPLTR